MRKRFLLLFILATAVILVACGSSRRGPGERVVSTRGETIGQRLIAAPVIRIGLVDQVSSVVTVRAGGGLMLIDRQRGTSAVKNKTFPLISFYVKGATGSTPTTIYRVQVASLSTGEAAERLADKIRNELGLEVTTAYSAQTRSFRVQVGKSASRQDAAHIESRLREAGYKDLWVVSDQQRDEKGENGTLTAVDAGGERVANATVFQCVPGRTGEFLQIGKMRYRGALELRVTPQGTVLPINIINLEQYLRGVVPAEMSSTAYPQIEALKAQALAARTYAVKNFGQYTVEGYDLCSSARCQVYGGVNVEQEMTDQAVEETRGQIIVMDGKPINALFTSTCGGHTENVENIFEGAAEPYLRGVYCAPEAESFSSITTGGDPEILYGSDGLPINFEIAVLRLASILPETQKIKASESINAEQLSLLVARCMSRLGKRISSTLRINEETPTMMEAVDLIATAAGWRERIDRQVSDLDTETLLDPALAASLRSESKKNMLYFLRLGFISAEPDGSLAWAEPLDQTRLIRLLYRLLRYERDPGENSYRLVARTEGRISVQQADKVEEFPVADDVLLFKRFQNYVVPVSSLQMAPGDRVDLVLSRGRVGALVHTPPMEGITSDRFSRFLSWDVKYTPEELQQQLKRYADVGKILELNPLRYGVSERIVELEVIGEEGSSVLKGLQIRWAFGLRENLFIIERSYDELGNVNAWRFVGRGWGHGVGLCQVGAYGMAMAGHDYREIVRHYYTGVTVSTIR